MNEAAGGAGAAALRYATPQELLGMAEQDRAELERRIMQALGHVRETGLLDASDLQLPIQASAPTLMLPLKGYEGGMFDPLKLGVACIVVPPPESRGSYTLGDYSFQAVCTPSMPFPPPT